MAEPYHRSHECLLGLFQSAMPHTWQWKSGTRSGHSPILGGVAEVWSHPQELPSESGIGEKVRTVEVHRLLELVMQGLNMDDVPTTVPLDESSLRRRTNVDNEPIACHDPAFCRSSSVSTGQTSASARF